MSLELIWTSQLYFVFSDHLANKLMPSEIKYVHLIIQMCNYFLFGCQLISSWNWGNYSLENTYYAFLKISLSMYKQAGTGWRGFLQNLSCSKIKWRLRIIFLSVFPSALSFLLYSSSSLYLPVLWEKIPICPILEVNKTSVKFYTIWFMLPLKCKSWDCVRTYNQAIVLGLCHNAFFRLIYAQILCWLAKWILAWADYH